DQSKVYGQSDPPATYTLSGFQYSDTKASATTGDAVCSYAAHAQAVASYPGVITCTTGNLAASDYSFVVGSAGKLTITPATLTVKADDQSKVYGQSDPPPTYTLPIFQYSDTKASATTGDAVCSYAAHAQTVASYPCVITCTPVYLAASDYSFVVGSAGKLTITPATLTVKAHTPAHESR